MELEDDYRAYTVEELTMYPYRALQQLSKMMALPSNVKKVVLVELIHARTMKSPEELEAIIQRVKLERQQNAQTNRKKAKRKLSVLQAMEVSSSTKISHSPPLDQTPKRSIAEDVHPRPFITYRPKHNTSPRNTNSSDRVLRSYNVKTYKRPNYSLINNSMFGLVRAIEKAEERKSQINILNHDRRPSRHNVSARCVNKKSRPRIIDCFSLLRKDTSPPRTNQSVEAHSDQLVPSYRNQSVEAHSYQLVPSYRNQSVQVHSSLLKPAPRNQLAPAHGNQLLQAYSSQMVAHLSRQRSELSGNLLMRVPALPALSPARHNIRNLSGLQPSSASEMPTSIYREQIQSIGFRRTDGKMTKFNALVQKSIPKISNTEAGENVQVTIQDIINSNIEAQTFTNTSTSEYYVDLDRGEDMQKYYPNMAALTDVLPAPTALVLSPEQNTVRTLQVYYHKKIRTDQVGKTTEPEIPPALPVPALPSTDTLQIPCNKANEQNQPIIIDVCSSINDVNPVTQPIYVRVSEESESHVGGGLPTIPGRKANELHLPKIHDAFSKFHDVNDVTKPIYVSVNEESEHNVGGVSNCGRCVFPAALERVYNYRVPPPPSAGPAAPLPAPARTTCVYSTPTVPTAMQQTSFIGTAPFTASCEQDNSSFNYKRDEVSGDLEQCSEQEMTLRRYHDALSHSNTSTETLLSQEHDTATIPEMVEDALELITKSLCNEFPHSPALSHSNTSTETLLSQEHDTATIPEMVEDALELITKSLCNEFPHSPALSHSNTSTETLLSQEHDTATIPEMVEDALELISQDGDYMERINMDVRMQCILCAWAGSKIVLDNHIRKEHPTDITLQASPEWNVTFALGSLATHAVWVSHVSEHERRLYILSAHYRDPDCFMASLTTLSDTNPKLGTITVYNKVTGEPYYWHDQIPELPSNMPYENEQNCLTVQLSQLDVRPNSTNLKLHNRPLGPNSPSKVVAGQPELEDIQITVFVKVHF